MPSSGRSMARVPGGQAGEHGRNARDAGDRVEQDLLPASGSDTAWRNFDVLDVRFGRGARQAVSSADAEDAHQMLRVVAALSG